MKKKKLSITDPVAFKGTVMVEKRRADDPNGLPYEVSFGENIWTTTGWNELLKIITGQSTNVFSAANTVIQVGTSNTAAAATQTALLGTTAYKALVSGYPTAPSAGTLQFKASFGTSEGNQSWQEWAVLNTKSNIIWNRGVSNLGTKTSSAIWDITITLGKA